MEETQFILIPLLRIVLLGFDLIFILGLQFLTWFVRRIDSQSNMFRSCCLFNTISVINMSDIDNIKDILCRLLLH